MVRRKNKTPRRHHVPPSILFSRKRELVNNLIRILQRVGIEMRICRMRYRDLSNVYHDAVPTLTTTVPVLITTIPNPVCYEEGMQTLAQDTLPDSPSPCTPDFLADDYEEKRINNNTTPQ